MEAPRSEVTTLRCQRHRASSRSWRSSRQSRCQIVDSAACTLVTDSDSVEIPPDGLVDQADAIEYIASQPAVWVRLAAIRHPVDKEWQHVALELTSGAAPPTWKPQTLCYPSAIFFGVSRKGSIVAG